MAFEKGNKLGKGRPPGASNKNHKASAIKDIYENLIGSFTNGNYYVYRHIYKDEIFYIGMGKNERAWDTKSRNNLWIEYTNKIDFKYEIKIISANIEENEAMAIEQALIRLIKPKCNIYFN